MNLSISVFVFCYVGISLICQVVSSGTLVESNNPQSHGTDIPDTDYEYDCTNGDHDCGDGVCIESRLVCDGNEDCGDNSDESNCTDYYYSGCSATEFDCGDGVCLTTNQTCDGVVDCDDGSDEKNCLKTQTTTPNNATSSLNLTTAKPETTTVDDYEYEDCLSDEYTCLDGFCIVKTKLCDGEEDCTEGEDEMNCNVPTEETTASSSSTTETTTNDSNVPDQCQVDEFKCLNLTCVPSSAVCDGEIDCSEGEDESNCTATQSTTIVTKLMEYTQQQAIEGCYYEDTFYALNSTITIGDCNITCFNSGANITSADDPCVACLSATANGFLLCIIALLTMMRNIV